VGATGIEEEEEDCRSKAFELRHITKGFFLPNICHDFALLSGDETLAVPGVLVEHSPYYIQYLKASLFFFMTFIQKRCCVPFTLSPVFLFLAFLMTYYKGKYEK
jgi:hypothetical protein